MKWPFLRAPLFSSSSMTSRSSKITAFPYPSISPRRPSEVPLPCKSAVQPPGSQPRHGPPLSLIHISEPTRLGMISYAVFCLKKKKKQKNNKNRKREKKKTKEKKNERKNKT